MFNIYWCCRCRSIHNCTTFVDLSSRHYCKQTIVNRATSFIWGRKRWTWLLAVNWLVSRVDFSASRFLKCQQTCSFQCDSSLFLSSHSDDRMMNFAGEKTHSNSSRQPSALWVKTLVTKVYAGYFDPKREITFNNLHCIFLHRPKVVPSKNWLGCWHVRNCTVRCKIHTHFICICTKKIFNIVSKKFETIQSFRTHVCN